jgi:hypothetical protein
MVLVYDTWQNKIYLLQVNYLVTHGTFKPYIICDILIN